MSAYNNAPEVAAPMKSSLVEMVDLNQHIADEIYFQARRLARIMFNMEFDPVNEQKPDITCMAQQVCVSNETLDKAVRILADIYGELGEKE